MRSDVSGMRAGRQLTSQQRRCFGSRSFQGMKERTAALVALVIPESCMNACGPAIEDGNVQVCRTRRRTRLAVSSVQAPQQSIVARNRSAFEPSVKCCPS